MMRLKVVARLTNYAHVNATRYFEIADDDFGVCIDPDCCDEKITDYDIEGILKEELDRSPMWEWDWKVVG
jgi:hypothetical protein